MLHYFHTELFDVELCNITHFDVALLMLDYFDIALFELRYLVFNVPLFHIVLVAVAPVNTVLFNVTVDEGCTFSFCSVYIVLLMSQVVLTITSSCVNG